MDNVTACQPYFGNEEAIDELCSKLTRVEGVFHSVYFQVPYIISQPAKRGSQSSRHGMNLIAGAV